MNPIAYAPRIDRAHLAMFFCAPCEPVLAAEVLMGYGAVAARDKGDRG